MTSRATSSRARATFGPGELPVFESDFFSAMPHGNADEWAFEQFKEKARAQGGDISDDLLEELRNQVTRAMGLNSGDVLAMMAEEQDYI